MAEPMIESLQWVTETASREGDTHVGAVGRVEQELEISPEEIHAACDALAVAAGEIPGTERFADIAGTAHMAFEWGVRWQREREDGHS